MRLRATTVLFIGITAGSGFAAPVAAQTPQAAPSPVIVSTITAEPGDVESIDVIVAALYDVISGPAGEARDWNRMRSLFIPGGRLMPVGPRGPGAAGMRILEVNDYIALSGATLERVGFTERELARRTERFGHIAHVFSTYEGRAETEDLVVRGINSIQLVNDGTRWWVISVFWEAETPDNPLPAEYVG
jgi:hypothetical protein